MKTRWQPLVSQLFSEGTSSVSAARELANISISCDSYLQVLKQVQEERRKKPVTISSNALRQLALPLFRLELSIIERQSFLDVLRLLGNLPHRFLTDVYFHQGDLELAACRLEPSDLQDNTCLDGLLRSGAYVDICEMVLQNGKVSPGFFHIMVDKLSHLKASDLIRKLWKARHDRCPDLKRNYTYCLIRQLLSAAVDLQDEDFLSSLPLSIEEDTVPQLLIAEIIDLTGDYSLISNLYLIDFKYSHRDFPTLVSNASQRETLRNMLGELRVHPSALLANIILQSISDCKNIKSLCLVYAFMKVNHKITFNIDTANIFASAMLKPKSSKVSSLELWKEFAVDSAIDVNQKFLESMVLSEIQRGNILSALTFIREMNRRGIFIRQSIRTLAAEAAGKLKGTIESYIIAKPQDRPLLEMCQEFGPSSTHKSEMGAFSQILTSMETPPTISEDDLLRLM